MKMFLLGFLSCAVLVVGFLCLLDNYLFYSTDWGGGGRTVSIWFSMTPDVLERANSSHDLLEGEYCGKLEEKLEGAIKSYLDGIGVEVEEVQVMCKGSVYEASYVYSFRTGMSFKKFREQLDLDYHLEGVAGQFQHDYLRGFLDSVDDY